MANDKDLEISTICLDMPFHFGSVNCYLVKAGSDFILVDTGGPNMRKKLQEELERAGCKPGNLKLIILTHGDFDHTGNAAYLREKYATQIGMHSDDWGMLEYGDMFWNRKKGNALLGKIFAYFSAFGKSERCKPDVTLRDGDDLSAYGFEGRILSIPGHSRGSIGILMPVNVPSLGKEQVLLCGDLFEHTKVARPNTIMDDPESAKASFAKLKSLRIGNVYPGHGKPFLMDEIRE